MVWHHSLPLMNSFNKTEAAVFSYRLCFLRAFPFISLRNIYHKAFIFHSLIGRCESMPPIDFVFTRSNFKVTRVTKTWFLLIILRTIYHRALMFPMLICLGKKKQLFKEWCLYFRPTYAIHQYNKLFR